MTLVSVPVMGQVIMEPGDREALVGRLEALVSVEEPWGSDATAPSPFREVPKAPDTVQSIKPAREWNDALALEEIAKTFKPTGSLIKAGIGYLLISGGRRIAEGEIFEARIGDEAFQVQVEAVSANLYRLRLGDSRIEQTFEKEEGR